VVPETNGRLIPPGDGEVIRLFGVRFLYKVQQRDSDGALAVLEVEIPPKTLVKPHTHTREAEFSIVLAGTVGVRIGDEVAEAVAGSYLVKPPQVPHAMWNAGDLPATVAEILCPAGLEAYFRDLEPILTRHAPPEDYYGLADSYGIVINDDWIEEIEKTYGVRL
jgi:quercetin dioxygenase-like cupin family protein